MRKFYTRFILFLVIAAFCVLLGVNLAGDGVEAISGPAVMNPIKEERTAIREPLSEAERLKLKEAEQAKEREAVRLRAAAADLKRRAEEPSLFGSIGSLIGTLLNRIAAIIISIFTAIFDAFI